MKQFFESYGGVALGILALLVLIAMITPVGNIIKTSLQGTTNKFASSMNGQLDDAMVATAEAQESATEGPVDLTNINKNGVIGDFSAKGNLVEINGTQYRVLEVNGTQTKVMSMKSYTNAKFNNSYVTTSFENYASGRYLGQKYAGSNLDNAMLSYYNSLPSAIQNAIVEQNINQSIYSWTNGTNASASFSSWYKSGFTASDASGTDYYATRKGETSVGNRKVYALDVDDVIAYFGSNPAPQDLNELFWNQRSSKSYNSSTGEGGVWLRSAGLGDIYFAFRVYGNHGYLTYGHYSYSDEVRPAFVIDLSLL